MSKPILQSVFSNSWKVLGSFIGLSILMRFFSFFPSVINHDESTYILIADAVLHGKVYMRDVFDTKPIGIFLLFAFFQLLFGKAIIIIRIITTIWIAFTAWMIYRTHLLFLNERPSGNFNPAPIASGLIYIFLTSIFTHLGVSPNTELFFTLFAITALFLILRFRGLGWFFLAGLLLGLGFMIKYVVLFDAVAFGFYFIWQQVRAGKRWSYWFFRCALMAIGFMIPLLLVWSYYIYLGLGDAFVFYSFEVSGRYFQHPAWYRYVLLLLDFFGRYFPVTILFFYCLWDWRRTGPGLPLFAAWWGTLVMIIILLPGKMFSHYFIQFMLPFSLLAGSFFDPVRSPGPALAWMLNRKIGYPLLGLLLIVNAVFQKMEYVDKKDYPREVASYLNTRLQPGDLIYTGNFHPIVYQLTGTHSLTPYIHRSLIWTEKNQYALNIDGAQEFDNILQQKPRFILMENPIWKGSPLYEPLQNDYTPVKSFDNGITVYERR